MHDDLLLHPESLQLIPFRGSRVMRGLRARATEVVAAATKLEDTGLSILIRTRNDERYIGGLLADIEQCTTTYGQKIEIIIVDTESQDRTLEIITQYTTRIPYNIISIKQETFSYPKSLNIGFETAQYNIVLTLVGHSLLPTMASLLVARIYAAMEDVAGAYGWSLTNNNARISERLFVAFYAHLFWKPPTVITKPRPGAMAGNSSIVRRDIWKALGGYDETYGAGAEDLDFARRALEKGYRVIADPLVSVHHSHALSPINFIRQLHYWNRVISPHTFSASEVAKYRKDLQLK